MASTIKRPPLCPKQKVGKNKGRTREKKNRVERKLEIKKKGKDKKDNTVGNAPVGRFPSLPFKILTPSKKGKKVFLLRTLTIQVRFPQSH